MLSPAMYRAITKGAAISYPSEKNLSEAADLFDRFNSDGLISSYTQTRCLVDSGRSTTYSEEELNAFFQSDKSEIKPIAMPTQSLHLGVICNYTA